MRAEAWAVLPEAVTVAARHGWALALHGTSITVTVTAIQWADNAAPLEQLRDAVRQACGPSIELSNAAG